MPRLLSDSVRFATRKKHPTIRMVYAALLFLSMHWAVVIYLNSTYLEQFVSETTISALYFIGSLCSLILFFNAPLVLKKIGNYHFISICTVLEILAVVGMGFAPNALLASLFFIIHFVMMPLLLFSLDVFIEAIIGTNENQTGATRGLYLSVLSLATALGPLFTSHILMSPSITLPDVYFLSAIFLLPFAFIIELYFRTFKDPKYTQLSLTGMTRIFTTKRDTRNIVLVSFFLQLFFTWMVIYAPLYLAKDAGFSLSQVGLIFFVGLLAYVLFEYPIGVVSDKYLSEKTMMAFGFGLLAVATSWYAFLPGASMVTWMCAVFVTRIGASFVEATSESYFFKRANSIDTDTISLFRMTRPFSSLIGAVLGGVVLLYIPFNLLFVVLGLVMIPGLFITLLLSETIE